MSLTWLKKHPEYKTTLTNKLQKHEASLNANKFKDLYAELSTMPNVTSAFTELLLKANINPLMYMNYIPQHYLYASDVYINFEPLKHFDSIDEGAFAFSGIKEINVNVPVIFFGAFSRCKKLEIVTLPTIRTIDMEAFYMCENLTQLWVGKSLVEITKDAFEGCNSLTDIFYEGTQEDWDKIYIHPRNTEILDATVHFNSIVK